MLRSSIIKIYFRCVCPGKIALIIDPFTFILDPIIILLAERQESRVVKCLIYYLVVLVYTLYLIKLILSWYILIDFDIQM